MDLNSLVAALNAVTPLSLAMMLAYIIYLLVSKNGPVKQIGSNHLHDLPVAIATLSRIEETLRDIRDGINFLKGRVAK